MEVCEVVSGITQKCTRSFKVLVFKEAICVKKQIEENSKKVLTQSSDTLSEFNQSSFFVTNFDEHYTYEIKGDVLELCAQGAGCFSLIKYLH